VVPDFARDPFSIARCATFRLTKLPWWKPGTRPEWKQIDARSAAAIFIIVEG
jgi:hypothetical protein